MTRSQRSSWFEPGAVISLEKSQEAGNTTASGLQLSAEQQIIRVHDVRVTAADTARIIPNNGRLNNSGWLITPNPGQGAISSQQAPNCA